MVLLSVSQGSDGSGKSPEYAVNRQRSSRPQQTPGIRFLWQKTCWNRTSRFHHRIGYHVYLYRWRLALLCCKISSMVRSLATPCARESPKTLSWGPFIGRLQQRNLKQVLSIIQIGGAGTVPGNTNEVAWSVSYEALHEQKRELLWQCPHGNLPGNHEEWTCLSSALCNKRTGKKGDHRIHWGLLQQTTQTGKVGVFIPCCLYEAILWEERDSMKIFGIHYWHPGSIISQSYLQQTFYEFINIDISRKKCINKYCFSQASYIII